MKYLINMLNSYPGVEVNEYDFIFSKPTFDPIRKMDVINVRGKLNSKVYIDQDFWYKRFDLTTISAEQTPVIEIRNETEIHHLLNKLNDSYFFPYQEGGPLTVQDKYLKFSAADLANRTLPVLSVGEETTLYIEASDSSFYFRGTLAVKLRKSSTNINSISKLEFFPFIMKK